MVRAEEDQESDRKETDHFLGSTTSVEPSCLTPHRSSFRTVGRLSFCAALRSGIPSPSPDRLWPLGQSLSPCRQQPSRGQFSAGRYDCQTGRKGVRGEKPRALRDGSRDDAPACRRLPAEQRRVGEGGGRSRSSVHADRAG